MIIIYIDIILLVILLCLTLFTCGYCFYRVYTLQRDGQVTVLLRPTKVLFSHKKEGETEGELRTVVAYKNPFTGDYCVHKNRVGPTGYSNKLEPDSPDSGVSDEYEPLHEAPVLQSQAIPYGPATPKIILSYFKRNQYACQYSKVKGSIMNLMLQREVMLIKPPMVPKRNDNTVSKTWNWNYTEYQI